ncbi:hypothetical protein SLE2022_160780 [Rubroshorea leprosula]
MLLLRNPISHTKKFFKRTLQSFKSFFSSETYQKLPKSSPCEIPYSSYSVTGVDTNTQAGYQDLEKFYSDFTERWDGNKEKGKRRNKKKIIISTMTNQEAAEEFTRKDYQVSKLDEVQFRSSRGSSSPAAGKREAKSVLVAEKLKELEMMDVSNVDHVLDIEEVLHYYSRLTCPAYLDIVDRFFMEMYAELAGQPATTTTPVSVNSKPKFRSMGR